MIPALKFLQCFIEQFNQYGILFTCLYKTCLQCKYFYFIPFYFVFLNGFGQPVTVPNNRIIHKIDGDFIKNETLASQLIKLSLTDQINVYFNQIKDILIKDRFNEDNLNKEFFSDYYVRNMTQRPMACSMEIYDKGVLQKVVAVNIDYYYPKVSQQFQKAMFIWIIGHELKHLQRGDPAEDNKLENITGELICDEAAGYLVGRLTDNITFQDIGNILKNVLSDISDSIFTTKIKYRICAAQAGWLRAKEKNISETKNEIKENLIIEKKGDGISTDLVISAVKTGGDSAIVYRRKIDGSLFWGISNSKGDLNGDGVNLTAGDIKDHYTNVFLGTYKDGLRNGFFRAIWENEEYEGAYSKNLKNGYGIDTWYSGERNGQKYEGNFKDDVRNGFGIYRNKFKNNKGIDTDTVYVGEWQNGLRNGKGVLYTNDKVVFSGCWNNDAPIPGNCE